MQRCRLRAALSLFALVWHSGCGWRTAPGRETPQAPDSGSPREHQVARPSPIAEENRHTGDTGWRLTMKNKSLAAYADKTSYRPGETAIIHVGATRETSAGWELWRLGYYQGMGGRRLALGGPVDVPAALPPVLDAKTGAVRAPWPPTFAIPLDPLVPTGVYLVKVTMPEGQTYATFVVREAKAEAPILVPLAVNTYQAYNAWGGTSLYTNRRSDWEPWHAYAASFTRPYAMDNGTGLLLLLDRDFLVFMEGQGYDMGYATDVDLDFDEVLTEGRRLIVFPGHSEYWTRGMRDHTEAALKRGTNLMFLGANDAYWQVRYEAGQGGMARSLMVGYKEFADLDPRGGADGTLLTTQWRDPRVHRPENALMGIMYGAWVLTSSPLRIEDPASFVWTGTGVRAGSLIPGAYGIEVDRRYENGEEPPGLGAIGQGLVEDHEALLSRAQTTLYKAASGATVFAAGSLTWTRALARAGAWDWRIQLATANLVAGLSAGGQLGQLAPVTLQSGAPSSQIRSGVAVSTVTTDLKAPIAVAAWPGGGAIVVDEHRVVRVTEEGTVLPVAGGLEGDRDGVGRDAAFHGPRGVTVGPNGTIYVADTGNHKIRAIDGDGRVRTLAGSTRGYAEGAMALAKFDLPMGLVRLSSGTLLVADAWNHRIRAVSPQGEVTNWAGDGQRAVRGGPGVQASFYFPFALALRPDESVVVVESDTGLLRLVEDNGEHTVSTLAGDDARRGWADGEVTSASVSETLAVAVRGSGELILLDGATCRVRALNNGRIETLAGGEISDLVDGEGGGAGFHFPRGVAVAADGTLFVADTGNHALRRLAYK